MCLPFFDNGFELFRIGGDRVIPPFHVLIESEMFLDHARAKCDGSEWNRGSQCVIAKAYRHTEGLLQSGHVAQMNGVIFRRVDRHTMQQDNLLIAFSTHCFDGSLNFGQRSHACGNDHRALFARDVLQEGEMNDVHRSDLKERHIKLLKQVCFLDGETVSSRTRCRETCNERRLRHVAPR